MRRAWTQEEIDRLTEAISSQGFPQRIDWVKVMAAVGRNKRQCRGKWQWELGGINSVKRTYTVDWSHDEDLLLYKMRILENLPWSFIEPYFEKRTGNQLIAHAKTLRKHPPYPDPRRPFIPKEFKIDDMEPNIEDEWKVDDKPLMDWEQIAEDIRKIMEEDDPAFQIKIPDLPE
jgi:hypothetical protein